MDTVSWKKKRKRSNNKWDIRLQKNKLQINYIGITRDNKLFCTSKLKDVIFRVANMAVMQFPPKLSLKIDVNKEFLITIKQILLKKIIVQFYLQLNFNKK